ncbi:MAG: hypothetical protein D3906_09615 [Candidatus Electrothrix sp. AUS1_2]|nr:hypothetical protein [Candidatus Electrothrix sp. AUS1_2]
MPAPQECLTAEREKKNQGMRKEEEEKKIRVVLDLVPNYSYDLQQVFFKEENLFVIIINTLGNAPAGDPSELLN